jgi:hypothetical protein
LNKNDKKNLKATKEVSKTPKIPKTSQKHNKVIKMTGQRLNTRAYQRAVTEAEREAIKYIRTALVILAREDFTLSSQRTFHLLRIVLRYYLPDSNGFWDQFLTEHLYHEQVRTDWARATVGAWALLVHQGLEAQRSRAWLSLCRVWKGDVPDWAWQVLEEPDRPLPGPRRSPFLPPTPPPRCPAPAFQRVRGPQPSRQRGGGNW